MVTTLPASEFRMRLATVRERLADTDADAAVFFDATSIEYLTGFDHIQTERPVVLAVTADTVAITEDGTERLTYYPRDLESNVVR